MKAIPEKCGFVFIKNFYLSINHNYSTKSFFTFKLQLK